MRGVIKSLRTVLLSVWLRLITVSVIALLFTAILRDSPSRIGGWFYYLTIWEVLFELVVRVAAVALTGLVLGTVVTTLAAPFLCRETSRERLAESVLKTAVVFAAFCVFGVILKVLFQSAHISIGKSAVVSYCVGFAVALGIPHTREWLSTSLDHFLDEKTVRRTAIGIAILLATVVIVERAIGMMTTETVHTIPAVTRSGPNILMITFDALSAEDMSLYGYRLPTTPHIDEFARRSTVFTSVFSASTFTTPCVATILTGIYPSEHHVYHLKGHISGATAARSLPHLLRAANYYTGAWLSNQFAYFLAAQLPGEFDVLPPTPHASGAFMNVWDSLGILHQRQPFGSRAEEFDDFKHVWDYLPSSLGDHNPRLFGHTRAEFPPSESFAQAKKLLDEMPPRFFLWIHVLAPHAAYLAEPPHLGQFLGSDEMRTAEEQLGIPWWPRYAPRNQSRVDKARLRYDEFLAETDDALGAFLGELESAGKLRDTAVIISADHGESFEGGVYTHGTDAQAAPEIHIPLVIHMPGQQHGSRVAVTADETALAPTVLDIAGLPRPDWMSGQSLLPSVNRDREGQGEGLAFTQFLWGDSIFEPLRTGTVGVTDGYHQYVINLATSKGTLRDMAEPQSLEHDLSPGDPALAKKLRDAIYTRFPNLPRKTE